MFDISDILNELSRREVKAGVLPFLFPKVDIKLEQGRFPCGHKLFEGQDKIFSKRGYEKHLEFFKAGAEYPQRLFCAANRVGKTVAGATEVTYHVTGLYPDDWQGHKFTTCSDWWVVGKTIETVRDILQPLFLGRVGEFGTGLIPADCLDYDSLKDAKKASTTVGTFRIKHKNGTFSSITFKAYKMGRGAFEGTAKSIFMDEEPPREVYTECLTRTATGGNILIMTFTPLQGMSDVVQSFFPDGDLYTHGDIGGGRYVVRAGWDDIPHLDEKTKQQLLESYPVHEREARSKGIPSLGSGAIYPIPEETFVIDPFEIPKHWKKSYGFDVGRNTAATWTALDPDSGMLYTYSDHFQVEGTPSNHVDAIQARGKWIYGAIDTAARGRSQTDGENLFDIYKEKGLKIQNADKAVSAGIYEIQELLMSGRLKVFSTCKKLLEEFRGYQRDSKGNIIKKNDHCFVGETLVWTSEGKKPIRDLVNTTGFVHSLNTIEAYQNCRLIAKNVPVLDVHFASGTVRCTPDHLFLTTTGWIPAYDLDGRVVLNASVKFSYHHAVHQDVAINLAEHANQEVCLGVQFAGHDDVYCLDVPTTHMFAVQGGVMVHNCMDAWRYNIFTRDKIMKTQLEADNENRAFDIPEPLSVGYSQDSWMSS